MRRTRAQTLRDRIKLGRIKLIRFQIGAYADRVLIPLSISVSRRSDIAIASEQMEGVLDRLDKIELVLKLLVQQRTLKEWYSVEEAAQVLGKEPVTIRKWCRRGCIHAQKRRSGRGNYQAWVIPHEELERIQQVSSDD